MAKKYIPGETKAQRKLRKKKEKLGRVVYVDQPVPTTEVQYSPERHIVCLKWGHKYPADYVNKLYNMCKRHTEQQYQFHCFTENAVGLDPGITVHNLPAIRKLQGWWFKPWFFSNELGIQGTLLFLDLDVIICGGLDKFFTYKKDQDFVIIRDFNRTIRHAWDRCNSSVFRMRIGSRQSQWHRFAEQKDDLVRRMPGDQDWMYRYCKPFAFWPDDWVRSYKWEMRNRNDLILRNGIRQFKTIGTPNVEKEQSIAVFHGRPNPEDCKDPWVLENWR